MKFVDITLENVKGIKNGIYDLSKSISIFTGKNGSGKSTFIHLFNFILGLENIPDHFVKNGFNKGYIKMTVANPEQHIVEISKTATKGSQVLVKLDGTTTNMAQMRQTLFKGLENRTINYSNVLNKMKPKELSTFILNYIPNVTPVDSIISYMLLEYQSKDYFSDSKTIFSKTDFDNAQQLVRQMLPANITQQDIQNITATLSNQNTAIKMEMNRLNNDIQKFQNIDKSAIRKQEEIKNELLQLETSKTNETFIKQSWDKYYADLKKRETYFVSLQNKYDNLMKNAKKEPEIKDVSALCQNKKEWEIYKNSLQQTKSNISSSMNMLSKMMGDLDASQCPLCKDIVCTVDKLPYKTKIQENINQLQNQLNEIISQEKKAIETIRIIESQIDEIKQWEKYQQELNNYNFMLQNAPAEPLKPSLELVHTQNIDAKITQLKQELYFSEELANLDKTINTFTNYNYQYHINNYIIKNFAEGGNVIKKIMEKYIEKINVIFQERLDIAFSNWKIKFIFENGLVSYFSIDGSAYSSYNMLSTGEQMIAALIITDVLNAIVSETVNGVITNPTTMLIDGLECLDDTNFNKFMQTANILANSGRYANFFVNLVSHHNLINAVDNTQFGVISLNK